LNRIDDQDRILSANLSEFTEEKELGSASVPTE
jgi:hypothetical protein